LGFHSIILSAARNNTARFQIKKETGLAGLLFFRRQSFNANARSFAEHLLLHEAVSKGFVEGKFKLAAEGALSHPLVRLNPANSAIPK
jgi:hypothetical protein